MTAPSIESRNIAPRAFHVLTKPIGPICNLDCSYCFYLEKEELYPENKSASSFRMNDQTLEKYVEQYISGQDVPEIWFAWQGGEPTLMGLDFYKRVVEFQRKYCPPGKQIKNALQTNGTLLNSQWCEFLRSNEFLVGLSIDGPKSLHDRYRVDKSGRGTFDQVMRAWDLLKTHNVQYNTLTVVNREVSEHPLEVYEFLKSSGSIFMQFIPLVERVGAAPRQFASPPLLKILEPAAQVTKWSVEAGQYGRFLTEIFDQWVRYDVGSRFVQLFDVQLGIELGAGSSLCLFAETCGKALAIEHNGDLYSCDHFVYPTYKLGNIRDETLSAMIESEQQQKFGNDKRDALPKYCQRCEVRQYCNGECPKHRFIQTPDGEPGLNYLCAGYKQFFNHMKPYMQAMAELLCRGRAAAEIMEMIARQEGRGGMNLGNTRGSE
jgi:uncharacterized protein